MSTSTMKSGPFLLDAEMRWPVEPNAFLVYVSVVKGKTRSPRTWRSYAYQVADWLAFCEKIKVEWRHATQLTIATYRNLFALRWHPIDATPLSEVQTESGQADLIWLHSRVFKMQGVPEGRKAKWIGGPVSAWAVNVLERLTRSTRRRTKVRSLWVPIAALVLKPRDAGALKGDTIRYRLDVFVNMLGLKNSSGHPFHLHPHMFRRTFARHVARHDTTNLLALKEHFKHISLSMTDLYVGSDVELWQLMVAEEEKLLFESFEKAPRAERMAGPGGSRLKKKIDAAIAEGRLPMEFRGEAGDHLRKAMIRDLVESGQRIYPCAASNYCWFRPEFALCTQENHPLLKRCNPGACTNSIITLEHKPHWEKILRDCEDLMELKPQAEPYQRAIRDIHAVSGKILRGLS